MLRSTVWISAVMVMAICTFPGCSSDRADDNLATSPSPAVRFAGIGPIKVVCTTGPVADLLRHIGGEQVQVTGLMGPGVDPHLYKAVPADIEQLTAADAIFYNGLHLEGRMTDVFEQLARRKPTFAVAQGLVAAKDKRLRTPPEFEGHYDPHVWHDPHLWAECAKYVAGVLAEFDPPHQDAYFRNRDAYLKQLEEVDRYCREQLALIPAEQRALVTAHDAFGYFCSTYGLASMPLKGVSTEEEVTIGRMDAVIEFIVQRRIKAVFVETATAPQIVKALIEPCRAAGHEVRIADHELFADALGSPESNAGTYVGMLRANVDAIVSALK